MNVVVAAEKAKSLKKGDVMVVIICDIGERYLTKHHSDEWLQQQGFLEANAATLGVVLTLKRTKTDEELVAASPEMTVGDALAMMEERGFSQLPVIEEGKAVGSLRDNRLMALVIEDRSCLESSVTDVMEEAFPVVSHTTSLDEARALLRETRALLTSDYGVVSGIVTRHDLVELL